MSIDLPTLAGAWALCGLTFATWSIYVNFRGGDEAVIHQKLRGVPGAAQASPAVLVTAVFLGILMQALVWPVALTMTLVGQRRTRRRNPPLHCHPDLAKIRSRLAGREADYPEVFPEFGLDRIVTAVQAIKPEALTDMQGNAVYSRTDLIAASLGFTEFNNLYHTMRMSNLRRAEKVADRVRDRYRGLGDASEAVGLLITGYVHGWLPERDIDTIKSWYAPNLAAPHDTADHLNWVLEPILPRRADQITRRVPKGIDVTPEDIAAFEEEALGRRAAADATTDTGVGPDRPTGAAGQSPDPGHSTEEVPAPNSPR